jgi:hypothetical protein
MNICAYSLEILMDQKYTAEAKALMFMSDDLNDSDYLKLARDYRNNESGKVLLQFGSRIKQAATHKLRSALARLPFNLRAV